MMDSFTGSDHCDAAESGTESDMDCMESMRVLLADLRTSIETQRHLINVSRALLERS